MDKRADDQNFEVLTRALAVFDFLAKGDGFAAWPTSTGDCAELNLRGDACVVALANAGFAGLLLEDVPGARVWLLRAHALLHEAEREQGTVALRATSSGYHFRLAAQHSVAFEKASVARAAELRRLMASIVAHHLALLNGDANLHRETMCIAVEQIFGRASVEARLSRAGTLAEISACYAERGEKLRTILRHWPTRAQLTPEVAVAALALWPCEIPFGRASLSPTAS